MRTATTPASTTRTLACGTLFLLCGTFLSTGSRAQVTPSCPTFPNTNSTGCGAIIDISGTAATVKPGPASGPYDGSDDTLVGVVNNIPKCGPAGSGGTSQTTTCGISIFSLDVSSTRDICNFDGDGINSFGAPSNSKDSTGYGGPRVYFTPIPPATTINPNKCRVNFNPPLAPGGDSTYFSLENALSAASTPCTQAINNSLCDVNGANCGQSSPKVPSLTADNTGRATQIQATFVPQGINPSTGQKYTLAAAAQVCGFIGWDWQQTITTLPVPGPSIVHGTTVEEAFAAIPTPTTVPTAPFNDPPPTGYVYMKYWGAPVNAPRMNVYYDPFNNAGAMSLSSNTTANTLSFYDRPSDPCLPGGSKVSVPKASGGCGGTASPGTIAFTTHLVGLQGQLPGAVPVDTGIGFTWTSNNNGSTGGTATTAVPGNLPADPGGTGGPTVQGVTQTSTYTGVGVSAINGSTNIFGPTVLLSAVLPASRSVGVNATATAFATIINTGAVPATGCSIAVGSGVPVNFVYQTTDPKTNAVTGSPNTPVDIPAGGSQSFVIALTPTAPITPTDTAFSFICTNGPAAPIVTGLSTLLFSAQSTPPTPDVVALGATLQNDGIVHVTGSPATGVFAVAAVNLGASASITASPSTGDATLPLTITICQTNPQNGQCLQTPGPSVTTTINTNATPTFGIFVNASGSVPFDPANSRIFVQFKDSGNAIRGETSVAVTTQ